MSHPYGVQPGGNQFFAPPHSADARVGGLGGMRAVGDPTVLTILRCLGGVALGRLACVSRGLYVFAHFDDMWRDLTLSAYGGRVIFRTSWKATWVESTLARRSGAANAAAVVIDDDAAAPTTGGSGSGHGRAWDCGQEAVRSSSGAEEEIGAIATDYRWVHDPIVVSGFYSDYLYQWWRCASYSIDPAWVAPRQGRRSIERCSATVLSAEDFNQRFGAPNKPVVITDCVTEWGAFGSWSLASFAERFGSTAFHANGYTFTMDDYVTYARGVEDAMAPRGERGCVVGHDRPLYLFDSKFTEAAPALASEFEVPMYFRDDLFSVLGEEMRPNYRWLIVGPARSGSIWHTDPNATSAWNAVISGAKKWILYPPEVVPPGVHPSPDGALVGGPLSPLEWLLDFYDEATGPGVPDARRPLECVCRAGELIYVPTGWWHAVINLEPSIAITQNFVDRHNLPAVMQFLRQDLELVSGVPGRSDAEVAALTGLMEEGIAAKRPDLLPVLTKDHGAVWSPRARSRGVAVGGAGGGEKEKGKGTGSTRSVVEGTGLSSIVWRGPPGSRRSGGGGSSSSSNGGDVAAAAPSEPVEKKPCFRFNFGN